MRGLSVHWALKVLAFWLWNMHPAAAATYYVDQNHGNASDANAGTSESAPWLTLHRATDGVPTRETGGSGGPYSPVVAGDTVYVKNGTYADNTTAVDNDPTVKFNPTNAGTAGNPITFRAYPGHRPVVTRNLRQDGDNNPVIGASGANKNYITWSGFELGAGTDARCDGGGEAQTTSLTGCIIENLYIRKGYPSAWDRTGNWSAIYFQACIACIARNNDIGDVYYNEDRANANAAGIKLYGNNDIRIYNNDIRTCNTGIHIKSSNQNTLVENNLIYRTNWAAIQVGNANALRNAYGDIIRNNVIANPGEICLRLQGNASIKNIYFYNNTCWGGTAATNESGVASPGRIGAIADPGPTLGLSGGERPIWIYNNIFVRNSSDSSGTRGQQVHDATAGIIANSLLNYNLYWGTGGAHFNIQEQARGTTYTTLGAWQALSEAPDANSIAGSDPLFQVPGGGNVATNYMLQSGSPAINAGRVGGTSGGAAVNIGAYTGSECIGLPSRCNNRAPVLSAIGNRTVVESSTLSFAATATDPDGDALTFSASNLPSGATFNPATRAFSWTPSVGQAGVYSVTISVSDGVLSDAETFSITVTAAPPNNRPPVLGPIGERTVVEGATLTFVVTASDPDGDALTLSASPLPSGASFDPSTGGFLWSPTAGQQGNHAVTFSVTDGVLTDSEVVTLRVEPAATPDSGTTPDGGPMADAGPPVDTDAGPNDSDAGTSEADGGETPVTTHGCGCTSSSTPAGWMLPLGLLFLAYRALRRRSVR
ncbi:MAG: putative Ig domain-containing protein [Myxococcota bacterium]